MLSRFEYLMNRVDAQTYAENWIADWCRRDIEAIVAHYAEGASFTSPVAKKRTGNALVVGRDNLHAYWSGARAYQSFQFELDRTIWDEQTQELTIIYTKQIDEQRSRACEIVRFDDDGLIKVGEAMYGANLDEA